MTFQILMIIEAVAWCKLCYNAPNQSPSYWTLVPLQYRHKIKRVAGKQKFDDLKSIVKGDVIMSYNYQEIQDTRRYKREYKKIENINKYRKMAKRKAQQNREADDVSFDTVEIIAFLIFIVTMIIKTVEVIF